MHQGKHRWFKGIFLTAFSLLQGKAFAAPSSTLTGSTKNPEKPFLQRLSEVGTLSYAGTFRGSSLSNLGSPYQPLVSGATDPTSPAGLENSVNAGYKINSNLTSGVIAHFMYFPWSDPSGGIQRLQVLDPILYLARPGLITQQDFKLDTKLTLQLPLSTFDGLAPRHLAAAISAAFNAHTEFLSSRLTVGTFGYIRGFIPTADTVSRSPTYAVVAAPYANYQLSPRLAASLWIDLLAATRSQGTGFLSGLKTAPIDIEPGIIWDITKNISINPMLNIYPAHPTLASTSIQANLIAKAF